MASPVSAILLDAGGVLIFPEPSGILPSLRAAGVDPDLATLERAHYRAMAVQDAEELPPVRDTWWRNYLRTYVEACGVPAAQADALATETDQQVRGRSWAHVGLGVRDGLAAVADRGLPLGVVSNSDGTVEGDLRRLDLCYVSAPAVSGQPAPAVSGQPAAAVLAPAAAVPSQPGVPMGVIVDSAVVGVAKPDPLIFAFALDALGVSASTSVLHVGDSLRYDVAGAEAAGLRPVHMDPYGFCSAPAGHAHVRSLAELAQFAV